MRLSEYSDEELIEELKHRGIKIEIIQTAFVYDKVVIGGVVFELRT